MMKEKLIKYFNKKHISYIDYGCTSKNSSDDYNDFAYLVCKGVINKEVDRGILICGTGIGMSIAANKMKGIMCAKIDNSSEASLSIEHNHANVISFSAKKSMFEIKDMVDAFMKASPLNEEKYLRRIDKISSLEKKNTYK